MANYFEPVLSEEQLAAYLDGMLSTEESNMVEEIIASDPEMQEIQDVMDSVDSTYIFDAGEEIPIECLADDFTLPNTDGYGLLDEYNHHEDAYDTDDFSENGHENTDDFSENEHEDADDYQNDFNNQDYQDDPTDINHEDGFLENGFDDISF